MTTWKHVREFTRSRVTVEVELEASEQRISGSTRDVSMSGLYLWGERRVPAGAPCRVHMLVGGDRSGIRVDARGRVARVDAEGMAVSFEEVSLEGFQHLKQLVLLNSPDPDAALDEIAQHHGLRRRSD